MNCLPLYQNVHSQHLLHRLIVIVFMAIVCLSISLFMKILAFVMTFISMAMV